MTLRPLTEPLLRALVGEAREDREATRVLLVAATPSWQGEPLVQTEDGPVRVVPCVSVLAVRETLGGIDGSETLVIVTDRDQADLGEEVLARVWRQRLLSPSGWEALRHLFRVDGLDPALADQRFLVDLLVDVAPPRGYPPPPSSFLDLATAWRTLLRYGLRLDAERPTAADLLTWGLGESARAALAGPVGEHRDRIAELLVADGVPLAPHVLRMVGDGRGADLVAYGLVCQVLWAEETSGDPAAVASRARFETPLGSRDLTATVARSWGDAAAELVWRSAKAGEDPLVGAWLAGAERLLADLGGGGFAAGSDLLPSAFAQRLEIAGPLLGALLGDPAAERLPPVAEAADRVGRHLRAVQDPDRDRRLQMAVRLARRLVGPQHGASADLAEAARAYAAEGAWLDAARDVLHEGETVPVLAEAYRRLVAGVDGERRQRDLAFGAAFASWSDVLPTASRPLLPIERVLDEVVVPVARLAPVLLLVLDGLSHAEATRLSSDIAAAGWTAQAPVGLDLPLVVATVPTVTAVSRTSLLCGRLTQGDQDTERAGFAEHAGLRDASGGAAPRLFHKRDLRAEQGLIAPEVREVILDPGVRVVGVVVNGVDDHLAKGGQLRLAEGLAGVKPLRWLLDHAFEANRAVVLTSDHGHVREYGTRVRPAGGGGERWRPADPGPRDDEVLLAGPRVLREDGRVIAPSVENVRYVPVEKYGYHGGATPQEVLCPLAVLTPATVTLAGWQAQERQVPDWWDPTAAARLLDLPSMPQPEQALDAKGQPTLFPAVGVVPPSGPPAVGAAGAWVGQVLASPVLGQQRRLAGRAALDDDDVARFLVVLDATEGVVPAAALARALDLPLARLRTKLEALRRMLNVEGYPVLALEPDGTVRLNRELLETQFDVSQ